MRRTLLGILAAVLLLSLAACEGAKDAGQGAAVTDLPAGTLMMWIDFSWFAYVPASEGILGHDELAASDHAPQHSVALEGFWIQQSEVSNRQYLGCVSAGACTPPARSEEVPYWFGMAERADHPVSGVTWQQADDYCSWIYARLPSEAEWEIAARGTRAATYPWGESDPTCDLANFDGCQEPAGPTAQGEHPDGKGPYNALDMTGNVREWVHDWYAPDWYPGAVGGPDAGTQRVLRGGGFATAQSELAVWLRAALEPDQSAPDLGFRCALNNRQPAPAPYCQVPPVVGDPAPPLLDPAPPAPLTVHGYCENGFAGVVLTVAEGDDAREYVVIGPQGALNCEADQTLQACWGAGLAPDTTVPIRVCPDCPPGFYYDYQLDGCRPLILAPGDFEAIPPGQPLCPEGSVYIPNFGCFQIGGPPIDIECLPGFYYAEGCGCILEGLACLIDDPQVGQVEENTQVGQVEENTQVGLLAVCEPSPEPICTGDTILTQVAPGCWACIPWDPGGGDDGGMHIPSWFDLFTELEPGDVELGPAPEMKPQPVCGLNSLPPLCGLFQVAYQDEDDCWHCKGWFEIGDTCPQGSHFDAAAGCCVPDKPLPQGCPEGYIYDAQLNACVPIPPQKECQIFKVYIPACTTPKPVCTNPAQYKNQTDCTNAGCLWQSGFTGMPYCTNP